MSDLAASINHIAVVPRKPEVARDFFGNILGLTLANDEVIAEQRVSVQSYKLGNSLLEILTPSETGGPIEKFLSKGGGIHHLAVDVEDIHEAIRLLLAKGVELIDTKPRQGQHGSQIAFIHPRSTGGILVELVQS